MTQPKTFGGHFPRSRWLVRQASQRSYRCECRLRCIAWRQHASLSPIVNLPARRSMLARHLGHWAPDRRLSATIRALSASERTRRPDGPSRTSSRLTGPTGEPAKWTSFLLSNPIQTCVPSRRLLRTFILTLKPAYRVRAYSWPASARAEPRLRPSIYAPAGAVGFHAGRVCSHQISFDVPVHTPPFNRSSQRDRGRSESSDLRPDKPSSLQFALPKN